MFVVFDLDDTLADTSHRQHILQQEFESESDKWNAFFDACPEDKPKREIIQILNALSQFGHRIEIWTGRSSRVRSETNLWLQKHIYSDYVLRMRPESDHRHDVEVKKGLIELHGKPDLVFDDRNSVVKWWREQGVTCCQVKESTF